ncbi:MAG TPA: acetyl-CoA hydrolase/transferase C-terminal domain-containing protein [Sporichthyaceae bacterium]|jgi:acyl-CoA hydrolase
MIGHLRPGDTLVAGQVLGEPTALLDALFAHPALPDGMRLFVGMSLTDVLTRCPADLRGVTSVGMAPNGGLIARGSMDLVPCHMSELPRLLTEGPLATDVALIQVSPPDADGWCSLGVTADYIHPVLAGARVVLAEINDRVPVVGGDTAVHLDRITASIRTSRPLPEYPRAAPSSLERAIAAHVARFVQDGSCLQVGIGKLGEAVLQAVADRRDLGVHSGMVGDTLLELMRDGVITNKAKEIDAGVSVAGSILGSARALALAADEPNLALRAIGYTHDPARIATLSRFVCVNSALEVDLFGQVNSETADGRYVGAIGGSVDYLRGAVRGPGGRAIVALPAATPQGASRIVPRVERVTALGADVDVIATEHGVAELRGCSVGERARRLIAIAAPDAREGLRSAAGAAGL